MTRDSYFFLKYIVVIAVKVANYPDYLQTWKITP
jgi:hypothetical protein